MDGFRILDEEIGSTPFQQIANLAWRNIQQCVDMVKPHATCRWIITLVFWIIYTLRVYDIQGFYIISYGLGIYLLNLLIGFLSPLVDSDVSTRGLDASSKTVIRRLSEFAFWYSATMAICIVLLMTFFPIFDIPHLWPVMLFYWILLTCLVAFSIITPLSDIATSFLVTVLSNLTKDGENQASF